MHSLDALSLPRSAAVIDRPNAALRIATLGFCILAFIVLAGTRPFQNDLMAEAGRSGRGSLIEALLYLLSTSMILGASLHLVARQLVTRWTLGLFVVLSYCAFSLSWSGAMSAGIVRLSQLTLVSFALAAAVHTLGAERVFRLTYRVMIVILALNFASVAVVPGAIHQAGELGTFPINVTSWKGIHIHKNYAGPVAALTVAFALSHAVARHWSHVLVGAAALLFLHETNSTASVLALVSGLGLLWMSKAICALMGRGVTRFVLAAVLAAIVLSVPVLADPLARVLNDPYALTGRIELWHAMSQYIQAHPWTGSGYGSFWRIGDQSPILHLSDGWAVGTGQGHSGYLDLIVMIGFPGFALTVAFLVLLPIASLFSKFTGRSAAYDVFFLCLVMAWVHNTVETSFLSANHPMYFALMIGLFGLARFGVSGGRHA